MLDARTGKARSRGTNQRRSPLHKHEVVQTLQNKLESAIFYSQNVSLTPNCAAKGMPTVVPGPKKSPRAPPGTRSWFRLVMGFVCVQAGSRQKAVALAGLFTGVGNAEISGT